EGPGRSAFFVSAYSSSSQAGNDAVRSELQAAGVPTVSGLPAQLTPGVVAFVDAGSVDHNDFVTSAWGGAPLRDIFSRIGGEGQRECVFGWALVVCALGGPAEEGGFSAH